MRIKTTIRYDAGGEDVLDVQPHRAELLDVIRANRSVTIVGHNGDAITYEREWRVEGEQL